MAIKMMTVKPTTSFDILRDASSKVFERDADFSQELFSQQKNGTSHEEMEKMLAKIDEQAGKLSKSPTYEELKEYRMMIKAFVGAAVSSMYELNTSAGWDRMGRQRVFTTVRKIDTKLEEMAEKIRLGQSEQLDVIASHDAIRGMLVDLYM